MSKPSIVPSKWETSELKIYSKESAAQRE